MTEEQKKVINAMTDKEKNELVIKHLDLSVKFTELLAGKTPIDTAFKKKIRAEIYKAKEILLLERNK